MLWGWYTLRYYPPEALLEAIARRLTPLIHNMEARTLAEFIWAFGGLNYEPGNMQLFVQVQDDVDFFCMVHELLLFGKRNLFLRLHETPARLLEDLRCVCRLIG